LDDDEGDGGGDDDGGHTRPERATHIPLL